MNFPNQGIKNPFALSAGALRNYVAIQKASATQDTYGQSISTWTPVMNAWASIDALQARELYTSGSFASQVTHEVLIRWTAVAIAAGMRIVYGTHTYLIQAVENVQERNRVLKLLCLAVDDPE